MLRLHLALALLVAAGASACADEATSSAAPTLDPGAPTALAETTTSTSSSATSTTTAPDRTSTTTTTAGVARCSRVTDFDEPNWVVVNDGVMGGQSIGAGLLDGGVLTFEGAIVTDGGGFSSVRGPIEGELTGATSLVMRVRTDGRPYELLADDAAPDRGRVTHYRPIPAEGTDWQEVEVSLVDMEARIFGNPVTADPFAPDQATSIGVILADGVDGPFSFELDWIDACRD